MGGFSGGFLPSLLFFVFFFFVRLDAQSCPSQPNCLSCINAGCAWCIDQNQGNCIPKEADCSGSLLETDCCQTLTTCTSCIDSNENCDWCDDFDTCQDFSQSSNECPGTFNSCASEPPTPPISPSPPPSPPPTPSPDGGGNWLYIFLPILLASFFFFLVGLLIYFRKSFFIKDQKQEVEDYEPIQRNSVGTPEDYRTFEDDDDDRRPPSPLLVLPPVAPSMSFLGDDLCSFCSSSRPPWKCDQCESKLCSRCYTSLGEKDLCPQTGAPHVISRNQSARTRAKSGQNRSRPPTGMESFGDLTVESEDPQNYTSLAELSTHARAQKDPEQERKYHSFQP